MHPHQDSPRQAEETQGRHSGAEIQTVTKTHGEIHVAVWTELVFVRVQFPTSQIEERQTRMTASTDTGGFVRAVSWYYPVSLHTDFTWMLGSSLLNKQHRVRKECLRSRVDSGMAKDLVETGLGLSGSYCEDGKKSLMQTHLDFSFRDGVLPFSPGWLQLAGGPLAVSGSPSCLTLPSAGFVLACLTGFQVLKEKENLLKF